MNEKETLCGADCSQCPFKCECNGCKKTCGSPFGGKCIAAEYIKVGGKENYEAFKKSMTDEVNELLDTLGIPHTPTLFELKGGYVNLPYPLPNGNAVQFLKENDIYLGCQIEAEDIEFCYGVVCNASFILVCSYSVNGTMPELIAYKRR